MSKLRTYEVTFSVSGRFTVSVKAESEDMAEDYAWGIWDALNPYIVQSKYEIDVIGIAEWKEEDSG